MDDLFREILAPSPLLSSAPLPLGVAGKVSTPAHAAVTPLAAPMIDWEGEAEMQRLLDMLPDVRPDMKTDALVDAPDFPSALDLGLSGWDMNMALTSPTVPTAVAAF